MGLLSMAKINKLCVGESLVGDGNEIAHIDLIMGPRGSAAETAFANALTNNKDGFTALLALVAPNLMCKPATVLYNKVTIKNATQAVQMFGPAQRAVGKAVADSVAAGVIPVSEADNLFICVRRVHPLGRQGQPEDSGLQLSGHERGNRACRRWRTDTRPCRRPAQCREASFRTKLNSRENQQHKGALAPFYSASPAPFDAAAARSAPVKRPSCSAEATRTPLMPACFSRMRSEAPRRPPAA